jgi:hypothetical protein
MIAAHKEMSSEMERRDTTARMSIKRLQLTISFFTFAHTEGLVSLISFILFSFSKKFSYILVLLFNLPLTICADGVFQFPTYSYGRSEKETWRLLNR